MAEAAKIDDAAEKAYVAAAEKVEAKPEAVKPAEAKTPDVKSAAAKVEAPAPVAAKAVEAKPAPKPAETDKAVTKKVAPKTFKAPAKAPAKTPAVKAAAKQIAEAPAKRKYVRKAVAAAKPVVAAKKAVTAKKVAAKPGLRKLAVKTAQPVAAPTTLIAKLKESKMAITTKKTADDLTAQVQDTVKDVQARARTAFEKSQAMFGNAGEFTKGNLEAMVESGKILATGVQAMGKTYVAEVKSTFESVQADAKDLRAAVTSPTEFVKLQSTLMRKYFDNVVAYNSKSAEAALKLANEAFQPISSRVSLAVEKVKKAA